MNSANVKPPLIYQVIVHSLSIFLPGLVWSFVTVLKSANDPALGPGRNNPVVLVFEFIYVLVFVTVFIVLAYALAGGFEWQTRPLHVTRVFIFLVMTGVVIGLMMVSAWLFFRNVIGQLFSLNEPNALGRLFRVREIL